MQFSLWEFMKGWFDRLTTNGKEDAHCDGEEVGVTGRLLLRVRESDG